MSAFTMHDATHGLKVAHLMWHILDESRKVRLTPPEIALLVLSAHLHDLGMFLSEEQRRDRLGQTSDLWTKLDIAGEYRTRLRSLERTIGDSLDSPEHALALSQINQAQEALLCADTRERHATHQRYRELLTELGKNLSEQQGIPELPSLDACLLFGGDSFESALVDVCVSHNENAAVLSELDASDRSRSRFPSCFPVGSCNADIQFVAATLRLADILDFDRERVPTVLYHYLLPRAGDPRENISIREWQKHLTISNWEFASDRLIFRGRSSNPYIHHATLKFLEEIETEICQTRAALNSDHWPYRLPDRVLPEIFTEGFRYLPYQFSLKEEKIFSLLMGRNLYPNVWDCVRELIQNSVDSCQLRDSLINAYQPSIRPSSENRISVHYIEPPDDNGIAELIVEDSGTGMDLYAIENYLLKVGESYYSSPEFIRMAGVLASKGVTFDPVSEFGIGFVSVFMLADRVTVETAMRYSPRKDAVRRTLSVDGVGRLIHIKEHENSGYDTFEGTRVKLELRRSGCLERNGEWDSLRKYIKDACLDLPYALDLERFNYHGERIDKEIIVPAGRMVQIPSALEQYAHRIPVCDRSLGLEGELVLFEKTPIQRHQKAEAELGQLRADDEHNDDSCQIQKSVLTRGGFSLGKIPGLPHYVGFVNASTGRLKVTPPDSISRNLPRTNIARTELVQQDMIRSGIMRTWMAWMLDHIDSVEKSEFGALTCSFRNIRDVEDMLWLENYSAFELYRLARFLWKDACGENAENEITAWESGTIERLPLGIFDDYVHRWIFFIVLPAVCTLQIGDTAKPYATPPCSGWQEKLVSWNKFLTEPVRWGPFAKYIGRLEGHIYFSYPGQKHLSEDWQDVFSCYSREELQTLMASFDKICNARDHDTVASLSSKEVAVLKTAIQLAPDARIGSIRGAYSLSSFNT